MRGLVITAVTVGMGIAGPGLTMAAASPSANNDVVSRPAIQISVKPTKKRFWVRPATAIAVLTWERAKERATQPLKGDTAGYTGNSAGGYPDIPTYYEPGVVYPCSCQPFSMTYVPFDSSF